MDVNDIFQPYEKLIEIDILGERHRVPENNSILRCFQYLAMNRISYGDFCWNGNCDNCRVWIWDEGREKVVMACRTVAEDGMAIVRMADAIDLKAD